MSALRREISGMVMCHSHNNMIICDHERILFKHMSRDSAAGIATGYGLDD
jgi:hypothetical protein